MFEEFKEKLKLELRNGLPGAEAQGIMMPSSRDDKLILPTHTRSPMKSAVLVVFYVDNKNQIKFPLIQRPTYNGAHSAQVALPGGKTEKSDRDLIHTALREAEEEIGIDVSKIEVAGQLSDIFISVSNYLVTPVVGFMENRQSFRPDPLEVEQVIEADVFDIVNPGKRKSGTVTVRDIYRIQTPYFDIDNRIVWGATAMILSELSILIKKTGIFN